MKNNHTNYEYQIYGSFVFRFNKRTVPYIFDNVSFISEYFNDQWHELTFDAEEDGITPDAGYETITEEEALKIALSYGMTKEAFYK